MFDYNFPQIPLPEQQEFYHNHNCENCKRWTTLGILTYSDKVENTIFFCKTCVRLCRFEQLPKKTEFRHLHECMECFKSSKKGVIAYCSRCEVGDFICPLCLTKWLERITPEEYYDYNSQFA